MDEKQTQQEARRVVERGQADRRSQNEQSQKEGPRLTRRCSRSVLTIGMLAVRTIPRLTTSPLETKLRDSVKRCIRSRRQRGTADAAIPTRARPTKGWPSG